MQLGDVFPIHLSGAGVLAIGLGTMGLGLFLIARLPQQNYTSEDTNAIGSDRLFGMRLDAQNIASSTNFQRRAAPWGFVILGFIVVLFGLFGIYLHL